MTPNASGGRYLDSKRAYRTQLRELLQIGDRVRRFDELQQYIVGHSNLPGPRGNLELAAAWAEVVAAHAHSGNESLWQLLLKMAFVSAIQAPVNDPREMVAFCGALGVGVLGAANEVRSHEALVVLRSLARDPRWRMREGVAMALQQMLLLCTETTLGELQGWVSGGNWLEMRAAAAGLAESSVLQQQGVGLAALRLHERILAAVETCAGRKDDAFRVLRKGLAYTLSVIVSRVPEEGFAVLEKLVATGDPDVLWIVKQNLTKKRLAGPFPGRVEALRNLLRSEAPST